ncbi:MAG: S1/P1 nuclease [Cyclobacteriaceae bacterium]|nr:S1/P1 nuclease [Cyclobacteriaceae bacterium]
MSRSSFIVYIILFFSGQLYGWGKTGHRVIGSIAEEYISRKAGNNIFGILEGATVAMVGNFMDEIRSEPKYNFLDPWHYCTIPDGKTYAEAGTPGEGDIIAAIERLTYELETKNFTLGDEAFTLKLLIHLVGDIHQPLHVGNGMDRGGNEIRVEYFWEPSNLHRVWDSGIIDEQQLSYTEYSEWIDHPTGEEIREWQSAGVIEWAMESAYYRPQVYDLPENKKINYRYNYDNIDLVNRRLLQAGIRLAGILNDIYD